MTCLTDSRKEEGLRMPGHVTGQVDLAGSPSQNVGTVMYYPGYYEYDQQTCAGYVASVISRKGLY